MLVRITLDLEDGTYSKFSHKCIDYRVTKAQALRWAIGQLIKTGSWAIGSYVHGS